MEIAWLVIALLALVIVLMGWQWLTARNAAGEAEAKLEQAVQQAREAQNRLESVERELRAARDQAARPGDAGPDADAEGSASTGGAKREAPATQKRPAVDAGASAGSPATQVRPAAQSGAGAESPAATQKVAAKTALFVAPEADEPKDPNKGLPFLVVKHGDEDERTHHLAFDRVTAGRGPDNDIVLEDQNASRQHFTVSFTGNRFLLEDNDSTNGTRCNGESVARKWLAFGDDIQVGTTTIRFSCEGYDLKDQDPEQAVAALEQCVERQPDFIDALKLLAFMLERNVARKKEAATHWERIARLEASS